MEKSSMESETPAAAVDVEDADDDSVEIAFLDDDDDDDESDGGGAAAPADEAAAAGDAGDVPDVDFGDDGGSESSEDEARPAASPAAPGRSGLLAPRAAYRATWVRLASALRTDNKVKLKIYADKGKKAALSQPSIEGHELVTRAEARIKYHTFVLCCEECEKCTDIKEGFCVNPDQIAMVLENARDLKFEPAILEALERAEASRVFKVQKIMLRREKINGGSRGWAVVENVDDRAHILYACFTDDLSPPFQKRAWRAYKGSPPNPQAISAEELTEAVEMFHDGMPVDRGLKISLYLNRAENRLTRLQPLHRARGWEARDENEWERSQRDFVRDALRDCDFALQLAEDFVVDDEPDARPWVKRAKVKVALGDLLGAKADLRALALGGKNPKIRRTAALVNASIKAQEAKERDFYGKITDLSVISQ
ncbi:hypothetical protein JL720_15472 [Aureococcus anophagefferens]|nr:hypothetical protein JL720_15472 [Aureococcus anophagefferens]